MATPLTDQTVVVIGASSGIGLAIAKLAAIRGAKVVMVGRDQTKLTNAAKSIPYPAQVQTESLDAASRSALDTLFEKLEKIDHLILAASGGKGAGLFSQIPTKEMKVAFDEKFFVHWEAAQGVLPFLNAGSSITFITGASSKAAIIGSAGLAAVNGAIQCMVPTLARELAREKKGTRVKWVVDTRCGILYD
jgi:short-subunit dehydrogenase